MLFKHSETEDKFYKKLTVRLFIIAVFTALYLIFILLTKIPSAAEFLAVNFSARLIAAIGAVTGLIPFSVYEIFFIIIIIYIAYIIVALIVFLVRKNFRRLITMLSRAVAAALAIIVLYSFTAGFAYYRGEPDFGLPSYKVTDTMARVAMTGYINELYTLSAQFSDENNEVICPYSLEELYEKIYHEYAKIGDWFYEFTPRVKPIKFSFVMSYMGFSGVFFGPTAEANINTLYEGTYYMPHVIAHELAHAKGVMREKDADAVASYLLISSSDPYLRYCGLLNSYELLFNAIFGTPEYLDLLTIRPEAITNEWRRIYDLQSKYQNPLQLLFDKIIGWFINQNNQTDGMGEYNPDTGDIIEVPPDPDVPAGPGDPVLPPEIKVIYSPTQEMIIKLYFK